MYFYFPVIICCNFISNLTKNFITCWFDIKFVFFFFFQKRGHVILILDKDVQNYPWESLSILKNQSVSRMPSIDILLWQLQLNKMDCYAKANLEKVAYVLNPKVHFDFAFIFAIPPMLQ